MRSDGVKNFVSIVSRKRDRNESSKTQQKIAVLGREIQLRYLFWFIYFFIGFVESRERLTRLNYSDLEYEIMDK